MDQDIWDLCEKCGDRFEGLKCSCTNPKLRSIDVMDIIKNPSPIALKPNRAMIEDLNEKVLYLEDHIKDSLKHNLSDSGEISIDLENLQISYKGISKSIYRADLEVVSLAVSDLDVYGRKNPYIQAVLSSKKIDRLPFEIYTLFPESAKNYFRKRKHLIFYHTQIELLAELILDMKEELAA